MKSRTGLWLAAGALVIGAAIWLLPITEESEQTAAPIAQASTPSAATQVAVAPPATSAEPKSPPISTPIVGLDDDASTAIKPFRADAQGNLILDEQTRLKIEEVVALTDPGSLDEAVREQTKSLPPAAAKRVEELVDKYVHYIGAQKAAYPPNVAPPTPDDALVQLDGIQALRVAHFGAETARALYEKEETMQRELLQLMKLDKEPGLSMEERAMRAQELYKRLPHVAAMESKNRAEDAKRAAESNN